MCLSLVTRVRNYVVDKRGAAFLPPGRSAPPGSCWAWWSSHS